MSFLLSPATVAAFLDLDVEAAAAEICAHMRHLRLDGELRVRANAFAEYLGAEYEASPPALPERLSVGCVASALRIPLSKAEALVADQMLHIAGPSGPLIPRASFEHFIDRNERPPCPPPKPVSIANDPKPAKKAEPGTAGTTPNSPAAPDTSAFGRPTDVQQQRDLRRSSVRAALLKPIAPRTVRRPTPGPLLPKSPTR